MAVQGHYYYLGKDKKEYFTREDADKYGGGAIKRRWHMPIKQYEDIPYEELESEKPVPVSAFEQSGLETDSKETDVVNVPEGILEFDQLDPKEMKEILRRKGIILKGNPGRDTLLEKLKSLS